MKTKVSIVATVTLLMAIGFICMKMCPSDGLFYPLCGYVMSSTFLLCKDTSGRKTGSGGIEYEE